ncbi:MAG: hypothetical protein EPN97_10950 [Alphaproteobacteria bacterium]|nr:MAG: hypothetical protein EPN97_10950 [Alphaproteobacteria bacterium]
MSGERYIKQALIAAMVEHPDQDKYRTRAFSNENLEKVVEALAESKNKLSKADFFTPDDEGKYLIDTPGFWKNFSKVLDIVTKAGEKFTFDDFTKPLTRDDYRNEQRDLLDSARQNGGLDKIFQADVWKGRYDEMERLWYRVPMPSRRDLFRNDGLIDPTLKRTLLAAEGKASPEDGLAKAGLTTNDLFSAFRERGNYEEFSRKLGAANDYLRKDYLLLPDNSGDTIFYYQATWDKFADITRNLAAHGERFEVADFLRQVGRQPNILTRAAERKTLDKVFAADNWVDRLPEMLDLWSQVREGWKTSSMTARDFDNSYADAESKTYGKLVDFKAIHGKQDLLTPLDTTQPATASPILPLGLKSFWDNYADADKRLTETGSKLSIADLRQTSGFMGSTILMSAVKFGQFDKVVDISRKSGEPVTLDDFLSKDRHGNSLLNILAERNQLALAFSPDLWAGRVADMKTLWTHVRINDRTQVDYQQVEVAAKQATLKMQVKDKFKLKPNRPATGPG